MSNSIFLMIPFILSLAGLASVYLFSKDPARRARAWRLLQILLRDRS